MVNSFGILQELCIVMKKLNELQNLVVDFKWREDDLFMPLIFKMESIKILLHNRSKHLLPLDCITENRKNNLVEKI